MWRAVVGASMLPAVAVVAPASADNNDDSDGASGRSYGGRSTGPTTLQTLPADSNFPTPGGPKRDDLPDDVDLPGAFQSNVFCDPQDRPGLQAFGALLGDQWDRPGYTTSRTCLNMKSDHYDGRAIDWQLNAFDPQDRRIGDEVVAWLSANDGEMAKRFGMQSIIWNNQIFRPDGSGWQGYVGQSPHTDHVHFSFSWDGAMMRTSWWTGVPVELPDLGPCEVDASGLAVITLQARADATCANEGPTYLESAYTPYRGEVIAEGAEGPVVQVLQQGLGVEDDGIFGPATKAALLEFTEDHPWLETRDETSATLWHVLELQDYPTMPYRSMQTEEGDRGYQVSVLQTQLDVEVDGIFGPLTAEAVRSAQKESGLTPTGIVDGLTWAELDAGIAGAAMPVPLSVHGGNVASWTQND